SNATSLGPRQRGEIYHWEQDKETVFWYSWYKKLNSRSDIALILKVLKRYRSAEESDDSYTMHLWPQIDLIVVDKAKAI
ncbi:hypothetical protein PROFUN_16888, partial [Planoprotostelium fungivorum]